MSGPVVNLQPVVSVVEGFDLHATTSKLRFARGFDRSVEAHCLYLRHGRELIGIIANEDANARVLAAYMCSVLIETQSHITPIVGPVARLDPGAMRHAEHRMCVSTTEECAVGREGKEHGAFTRRTTHGNPPSSNESGPSIRAGLRLISAR